ncbi:hypothetical protein ACFLXP_03200 [Chloroflexota bacterium]
MLSTDVSIYACSLRMPDYPAARADRMHEGAWWLPAGIYDHRQLPVASILPG